MQINPRTLRYVLAIAEEKSFSRAAEKLFISQPSLSQHIHRAEQETKTPLFNRDTNPISLTFAGERYVAAARDFLALENRLSREMEDIWDSHLGCIVIGTSAIRGSHIVPQLFSTFKQKYPQMELALVEGNQKYLLHCLHTRQVDFAFVAYADQELNSIPLYNNQLMLAAPTANPIAQQYIRQNKTTVNLSDFHKEPFILLHPGQFMRNITDRIFTDYRILPNIAYETRSFDNAYRMALAGLGCTFAISGLESASGDITFFELDSGVYSYPLSLAYRKDLYLSQAMKDFVELAVSQHSSSAPKIMYL